MYDLYVWLNHMQNDYEGTTRSVGFQFLLFLAQIRAKIHRCFCKFIFWEIIKQNRLLKREEVVIVFFVRFEAW